MTASAYHNQILLLSPSYNYQPELRLFSDCMLRILNHRSDVFLVILDNQSDAETQAYLNTLSHPQLEVRLLDQNYGKANAMNTFIETTISDHNLPRILISVDSDIIFSIKSFDLLIEAMDMIPDSGLLGMRYTPNLCNPESNLFFRPKKVVGTNGKSYLLSVPFLCNIAGGLLALRGAVLRDQLRYELYPHSTGKVYYPDDAFLYDKLKRSGLKLGYLNGCEATHLRSAETREYPLYDFATHA